MFHSQFEKQIKQVKKFLSKELIRESNNSGNFSVLCVKKLIEWNMYIDYRVLNVVNIKNEYSLFRIKKCLDKLDLAIHLTTKYH